MAPSSSNFTIASTVLKALGWIGVVATAVTIDEARPRRFKTDIFFGVHRRRGWDQEGVELAFWLLAAILVVGVAALISDLRAPEKSAGVSKNALILTLLGLVGLVAHLIKFS